MRSLSYYFAIIILLFGTSIEAKSSPDVEHYDINIRPDFKTGRIDIKTQIQINNIHPKDTLYFGLNENFEKIKVTNINCPIAYERMGGWLAVIFSQESKKTTISVETEGNLKLSTGENRTIMNDSSLFLLWSDRFYPIVFDDWATVEIDIELPSNFKCIAPGVKTVEKRNEKTVKYVFNSHKPMVCFSVFADSHWVETKRTINGLKFQTLLHSDSQQFAEQIFKTSDEIIRFYSDLHCPYPYDKYSFVTLPGMYARRAFPDFVGYSPKYLEKEFSTTGHDAHETSLIWWNYFSHGKGPGALQWSEGLGDYAEILYDYKFHKPIPNKFQYFKNEYLKTDSEKDVPYNELKGNTSQNIVHGKYPWIMRVLHFAIGDSAFFQGTRNLFKTYQFKPYSIDELIACYENAAGTSLSWWKTEWLERKGIPQLSFTYEIKPENGKFNISGKIVQKSVVYHIPIEIGINSNGKIKSMKIILTQKETVFNFNYPVKPDSIILDPNNWIIKY